MMHHFKAFKGFCASIIIIGTVFWNVSVLFVYFMYIVFIFHIQGLRQLQGNHMILWQRLDLNWDVSDSQISLSCYNTPPLTQPMFGTLSRDPALLLGHCIKIEIGCLAKVHSSMLIALWQLIPQKQMPDPLDRHQAFRKHATHYLTHIIDRDAYQHNTWSAAKSLQAFHLISKLASIGRMPIQQYKTKTKQKIRMNQILACCSFVQI